MKDSYLLLDERMRFLNCTANRKDPTGSILEVGVQQALDESGWDDAMFVHRGGLYDWTRSSPGSCGSLTKELDW
jgi:radical S-adenosyl methionine domain-containing protein 2